MSTYIVFKLYIIFMYVVRLSAERLVDVMKRINMAGRRLKARACTAAVASVLAAWFYEYSTRSTRSTRDEDETRVQYPVDSR